MQASIVNKAARRIINYLPTSLPPMGWYFDDELLNNTRLPTFEQKSCIFAYLDQVVAGKQLYFSAGNVSCQGASCYFGFTSPHPRAGRSLALGEKFKSCERYGEEFYRDIGAIKARATYLVLSTLENLNDSVDIEVVNFWVKPLSLAGLLTLANFDSPKNDRVAIPFASGCQSMWTIPYKEKHRKTPRATVGALDPAMRKHVAPDTLLFSMPAELLLAMAGNIEKSFASGSRWLEVIREQN